MQGAPARLCRYGDTIPPPNVRRNFDINRKTYEEVTVILKSIQSLQVLRVDVNPEFGLPELTAEVGASN